MKRSGAMPTRLEKGLSKTPVAFICRCTRSQSCQRGYIEETSPWLPVRVFT